MDVKGKSQFEDFRLPPKAERPLLISLHKSGSTWVFSYIHKLYRKMGLTLPPNNMYSEFFYDYIDGADDFVEDNVKNEFIKRSFEERFALLESLRKFDLELALKAHVPEIIGIWPRFKEFYKGYGILVLKRRNIWSHYLNILFIYCIQQAVGLHSLKGNEEGYTNLIPTRYMGKSNSEGQAEDILKATIQEYNVQFKHYDILLKRFTRNIRFLNDVVIEEVEPEVMFMEDITTKWLENRFNVEVKKTPEPFKTLDFATYFKPEDMAIIKEKFEERFYSEFQLFGYEYK